MKKLFMAPLVAGCLLIGRPVSAATIIFDHCSTVSLCDNLTLTATLRGSAIDVAITAPAGYGLFGASGANRAFGFNISGPEDGIALSNLTPGFSFGGEDMMLGGGFGFFEYVINGPPRAAASRSPLLFTVTRSAGFSSDLQLFESNRTGFLFAAHLREARTGVTGFVAANDLPSTNTVVPEPASMVLLGAGLAALAARRRLLRKSA